MEATVSRCTLEDSSSFQRRSNLVNHTRDFPRWAWKILNTHYRTSLPFCATMNRNCPYSCFHRSPLWCLCTAPRWCTGWGCFSPFASAASVEFSTLEIVLLTFTRMYSCFLDVADVHQSSKVDFVLMCLLYDLLSFIFHCRIFIWNQHCLGERPFVCASRFPEACVSERQTSRVF